MNFENKYLSCYILVVPWCSGYRYCTTSFNKAWTQVLRRFKSCSRHVGDSWWWGSLTMVPAENKAKGLSSVNHTTKTIHCHHSISWPNFFAWLPLCREILVNMCSVIVCWPGCDVINLEIKLISFDQVKTIVWISWERKEFLRWDKKQFSSFLKGFHWSK